MGQAGLLQGSTLELAHRLGSHTLGKDACLPPQLASLVMQKEKVG